MPAVVLTTVVAGVVLFLSIRGLYGGGVLVGGPFEGLVCPKVLVSSIHNNQVLQYA